MYVCMCVCVCVCVCVYVCIYNCFTSDNCIWISFSRFHRTYKHIFLSLSLSLSLSLFLSFFLSFSVCALYFSIIHFHINQNLAEFIRFPFLCPVAGFSILFHEFSVIRKTWAYTPKNFQQVITSYWKQLNKKFAGLIEFIKAKFWIPFVSLMDNFK